MYPKVNPTKTKTWTVLKNHHDNISKKKLVNFFDRDNNRLEKFSIGFESFFFDFSKHFLDEDTIILFEKLIDDIALEKAKACMRIGVRINETENRSVLHIALRNFKNTPICVADKNIMPDVFDVLNKIKAFTHDLHSGHWKGYTGKKITDIVNIGIGGSDLGPLMVVKALKPYKVYGFNSHFVSNIDASDLIEKLDDLNPETTLFIVASKTFTTQETMTNARSARKWFLEKAVNPEFIKKHFVAVSTNSEEVCGFGIDEKNMFEFWDWVGGRYSLWSAIGLSIACSIGYDHFEDLLKGAEAMDDHFFKTKEISKNIPTMMALLGVWYNNFFKAETQAVLAYDHRLSHFSRYLQQGDMESNGKNVDRNGEELSYQSGQIIWGEPGTNGQHAFYQLIHQGTKLIPCDFIAVVNPPHDYEDHHDKLIANFIAQTEALMIGKDKEQVKEELSAVGKNKEEIEQLMPYKSALLMF